ncbi:MAG: squalene/phytoene synthase family protein [Acidobacteria bacterium]|nr:squalene/phytoene synthase family protein [Acidobacteriota bacterium]
MQDLLKQVSRSFYLTLRVLPRSINEQLSIAYLLARASDTVADTLLVEVGRRREALLQIRKSIQEACEGRKPLLPEFGELCETQKAVAHAGMPGERVLLENLGTILETLRGFSADDRLRIRKVLDTITHGQEMDLIRFGDATADRIIALETDEELDEYAYKVAGCVGEFWTLMCRAHVFPEAPLKDEELLADGIRFGKGLQLVNILRDLPDDLRQGRCYIPIERLSKHGLRPQDLLDADKIGSFRKLYDGYLKQTEEHLASGWRYTTSLPFREMRLRLACAWPLLIGLETVRELYHGNILDGHYHVRIPQSDTRWLILRSLALYPIPKAWNRLFEAIKDRSSS